MQIETKRLWHVFNRNRDSEFVAIKDLSLILKKGEFITIIGHSGSGKTTLIEHFNALIKPSIGEIIIDNIVVTNSRRKIKNIKEIRKKIGVVFQFAEYQLFEDTIEKDIMFGPLSLGIPKQECKKLAKEFIKIVDLPENYLSRSPFSLSGGQKRRVALAGILSMKPDFLVLDEPTAGLDPKGQKEIYDIFNILNKKGIGIVIVTHNLNHVLKFSQRTIVLSKGELIRDDKTLDIMYDHDFLIENELEPPKIVNFVKKLNAKGIKINKRHRNIISLVKELDQIKEEKNG